MQVKKSLLVAGAAATVGITGLTGLGVASAASNNTSDSGAGTIVDRLVEKFDLNRNEVNEVFDEMRSEHEAERQQKIEDKLDAAVEDGKLTEDQKQAILDKLTELKDEREANQDKLKDMTEAERKEYMEQKMDDLKAWAKEQGISTDYLRGVLMPVRAHGHAGMNIGISIGGGAADEVPAQD